ncbi:sulfite exporter TauE/SafE family protein [Bradyrhizobium guangzhouense]|uniref:sulfite exporter TauE/SafE family protein n=1 Tax=Bradyrhizobium guangzhouense TaxID=1325095 RepID=UPI0010098FD4|nr:sulfite exporter TauE/SafE family protein [Bradyrhizobium guangzhouense]RXH06460.1 sulfite exporter TauE/SafE family protein [Bradyrhizobium guangzhouense]
MNSLDALYAFSGLAVGILVGLTGVGGGSLMTPILVLLFGIHPATAVGTDLLFAATTKSVGTLVHSAARNIEWRIVGLLAAGSVPATILVLLGLSQFSLSGTSLRILLNIALGIVLLLTAGFLLLASRVQARYAKGIGKLSDRRISQLTFVLGLVMGVLVTLTSVGAGAIGVTILILLHPRISISRVVGSDIAHAVPLTLVAGAGHWWLGSVDWSLLWPLLLGSIPGIVIGSRLAGTIPDGAVRISLAFVLIAVAAKLVL